MSGIDDVFDVVLQLRFIIVDFVQMLVGNIIYGFETLFILIRYSILNLYDTLASLYNLLLDYLSLYVDVLQLAVGWIGNTTFESIFAILITLWLVYVFIWVLNLIKTVVRFIL